MASEKPDVWRGTLALMVLKTIEGIGPMHGYAIARRIEQTSGDNHANGADPATKPNAGGTPAYTMDESRLHPRAHSAR